MRLTRIYCPGPLKVGQEALLPEAGAHHVARVLRSRVGTLVGMFDGVGGEFRAEIVRIEGNTVAVQVTEQLSAIGESPLKITLIQGISRSERMDWALQKATELGVARIAPVLASRSVVRLDENQSTKKHEHWRNIVIGACEQSGRTRVPEVLRPTALRQYFSQHQKEGMRFVLSPTGPSALASLTSMSARVELLIGPEGGLEDDELNAAQAVGFMPVRLGPRVLRTETAAVTALSVLQAMWGDLI